MVYTGDKKKEYQRQWIRSRRSEWIEAQGAKCVKCGGCDNLEIDHVNREDKKAAVSTLWSRRREVREAELRKCQVLCKKCHLIKTLAEVPTPKHGTNSRYSKGCRCVDCREAHRDLARKYRASIKGRQ